MKYIAFTSSKTKTYIVVSAILHLVKHFLIGQTPYPGIDNKELLNLLKRGYRLEKPDTCSDEL